MRKIEALTAVSFPSGRFKLTPEQYRRRQHAVKLLDADQLIVEPKMEGQINFKRGEIIETDVTFGKNSTNLRLVDDATAVEVPNAPAQSAGTAPAAGDSAPTESPAAHDTKTEPVEEGSDAGPLASLDVDAPPDATTDKPKRGRR